MIEIRAGRLGRHVLGPIGAAAVVLVAARNLASEVNALNPPFAYERDFVQIYLLARAVPDRANLLLPIPALSERYLGASSAIFFYPIPHPPTAGLLVSPLALLDYRAAATLWLVFQLACLALSFVLVSRGLGARLSPQLLLGLVLLGLVWSPVDTDLLWGNYSLVLLALLSSVWLAASQGRPIRGGILLGLALAIKPLSWPILLYFGLRRDWRFVGSTAAVVVACYLATGLLVGPSQLIAYFLRVLPEVTAIYRASWGNISLSADAWHIFAGATNPAAAVNDRQVSLPLLASVGAASVAALGLPAMATGVSLFAARWWLRTDWAIALLVCLSVVVNPIAWDNYEVFLVIPIALVTATLAERRFPRGLTAALVGFGVLLLVPWWAWNRLALAAAGIGTPGPNSLVPGLPALFMLGPSLSVVGLAVVIALLGRADHRAHPAPPGTPRPGELDQFRL